MGEERRRRQAGDYPTEGADPGYARFSATLRKLKPKIEEREIGLAWMRAESPEHDIPIGRPEAFPVTQDHVVMHVMYAGGSLNGALPVADIDKTVGLWRESGGRRADTRQGIFDEIVLALVQTAGSGPL
jgi:hypothetical protein